MNDLTIPEQPKTHPVASPLSAFGITALISSDRAWLGGVTSANRQAALERLDAGRDAAAPAKIDQWVAALHVGTKHRSEDQGSLEIIQRLYRSTLSQYPASVARLACSQLMRESEWFPTVKELADRCDELTTNWNALRSALVKWKDPALPPPEPAPLHPHEIKIYALRDEQQVLRRKLGFVGDVSKLPPDRKAMFDRDREIAAEMRGLLGAQ